MNRMIKFSDYLVKFAYNNLQYSLTEKSLFEVCYDYNLNMKFCESTEIRFKTLNEIHNHFK